jgi:deoxyhypusine synthase
MKTKPIDLSRVTTYPIAQRSNKVSLQRDFAGDISAGMSVSALLDALPKQLGGENLNAIINAVVKARQSGKPVVIAIGGHVIKCGLQPVLKKLIDADIITAVAMNGSATIHDYEISLIGETSEDVGAVLHCGTFGMAEETGRDINGALKTGVAEGLGYGESLGRFIVENRNPHSDSSLLAACYDKGIPATVHVAIGTDIIHQHPDCDGAVLGQATFTDFRLFTTVVSTLGHGGVFINIGSAVIMPEVFLKALSIAQNMGFHVDGFTTANFDMTQHYRPLQNVVKRPTAGDSRGLTLTGHHEIMIPLLAAGILDRIGQQHG